MLERSVVKNLLSILEVQVAYIYMLEANLKAYFISFHGSKYRSKIYPLRAEEKKIGFA